MFVGEDEEVYCKHCAPSPVSTSKGIDPSQLRGGEDACPRCLGKVFETEMMKSKKLLFHKACFNCKQCQIKIDYQSMHADKVGEQWILSLQIIEGGHILVFGI